MNIFQKMTERPWEANTHAAAMAVATGPSASIDARKLMLHIFLVIVSMMFLLFFVTFITHSQFPGFEALAGEPWRPFANTTHLWINTILLALGSVCMHVGLVKARQGSSLQTLVAMLLAAFFTLQFVLAQLWLWQSLTSMGYGLGNNPANSYFYLMTAVHGLHLLGGLAVLLRAIILTWRGAELGRIQDSLKLCGTYWHYLLGLWVVLFVLLTRSPETYRAIAVACGLG